MTRRLRRAWNRLMGSVLGRSRESDLAEELDTHIQLLAEENIRRGLPPAEAHRRARLQFGSVESTKESCRDQRGRPILDAAIQDLRYAFRGIRKNPGFAAVAILSLAIGIGANAAIFSIVNAVLLKPLAFKDPQRLFAIRDLLPHLFGQNPIPVNPIHAREWAKECPSLEHVALMRSNRADVATGGEPANREKFFDRLLANASAIPGVQASGFVTALPTRGETWQDPIYLEGEGSRRHPVNNRYASPGYFRAMSIAIRNGRAFEESDRGRGVAVLSEKAAKLLWPGEPNPVGRRFMGEDDKVKTLVGIVADVRAMLHSDPPLTAYYPWWQRVPGGVALVVRTTADPYNAAGALRTALRSEDAQLPIRAIRTMEEVVDLSVAQRRFQLTLMVVFAASALLVASLGIYGVVSYSVARRRNEIGIRMAVGAQRSRLLGLVIRQGMAPVVVGLAAGLAVALLLGRAIRVLLFEVQPTDPLTIAGVSVVMLVAGFLACLIPARRAAGTDAVAALRFE